ncbi:MAG TPA: response regulator [Candidatus Pelethocola excrementipullorum]|nr:response regulator [Candidatus Pelethocola excrementipullorum]
MKRILIADDEISSGEIIAYYIEKYKLPLEIVGEARDGQETLDLIEALRPDIVFLDIEMPRFNGLEVMQKLKKIYKGNILFIIITAFAYFEYAQKSLQLGAKDLLLKPIQYEEFQIALSRAIGYKYTNNVLLNDVLEYLHENYMKETDIADCAALMHTTPSSITRLFKNKLGTTYTNYRNDLRITQAKKLLEKGAAIKEAAEKVGYNNLNYFYKIFKKQTGMTPKEYISNDL